MPSERVLVFGTLADSLINFRGPMLREMVARGNEVHTLAAEKDPLAGLVNEDVAKTLSSWGLCHHAVPLSRAAINPAQDMRTYSALRRLISEVKPSRMLCYTSKAVAFGCLAGKAGGVGGVFAMITGVGKGLRTVQERGSLPGKAVAKIMRKALNCADGLLFQNVDDEALFIEQGLCRPTTPRLVVNGSGVDLEHYRHAPLPSGQPSFLMIGRLLVEKGVREYVRASACIRRKWPEVRCLLVGPMDPGRGSGISLAEVSAWRADGAVEYCGSAADVRPFLEECSVFVLPSYREGTPRTVLEAMATGRAVITTDAPGCRATVIHGANGFLVPVGDSEALATAMERFLVEPALCVSMAEAGRKLVAERYDVRNVNNAILSFMGL